MKCLIHECHFCQLCINPPNTIYFNNIYTTVPNKCGIFICILHIIEISKLKKKVNQPIMFPVIWWHFLVTELQWLQNYHTR